MHQIRFDFRERCLEITGYLDTLLFIEQHGSEIVSRDRKRRREIDITTRHVLKASVFIHLYNLVESTVAACLQRVALEIESCCIGYAQLTDEWRASLLRELGKASQSLGPESRLSNLVDVCNLLFSGDPLAFKPAIAGGNLDDSLIEKLLKRHGIDLILPRGLQTQVKKHVVDEQGPLAVIKVRRNELAHGLTSFGDCGRNVSVPELRAWTAATIRYLRRIIEQFEGYIVGRGFQRTPP